MNKPNIVLFLADDLGMGDLSCINENSKLNTENIDRIAREGVTFTDAHSCSALCTPSRYGLMTGRYNWRSRLKKGVLNGNDSVLIENGRSSIADVLKGAGYQTACIGKWHLGLDWNFSSDPDLSYVIPGRNVDERTRRTLSIDFKKPISRGPNDCGFDYSYVTPGSLDIFPYVYLENGKVVMAPDKFSGSDEYWPAKGKGVGEDCPYMSTWPVGPVSEDYIHRYVVPHTANIVLNKLDDMIKDEKPFFMYYPIHAPHAPCLPMPEFSGKSAIGPYGDMVLEVDDIVGRIDEKLRSAGVADNTIFIFASDNGGEHDFAEFDHSTNYRCRGFKADIWDGGHRIPLIIRWPGEFESGKVCDKNVCLTDIYATLSALLGHELGKLEAEDSFSLLGLLSGSGEFERETTIPHSGKGSIGLRKGKWKIEMCKDSGGTKYLDRYVPEETYQLYDMESDIGETENLYTKQPQIAAALEKELMEIILSGATRPGSGEPISENELWDEVKW